MKVDLTDSFDSYRDRITPYGSEPHKTQQRRQYLEGNAKSIAGSQVFVQFTTDPTHHIKTFGEREKISINPEPKDQSITNMNFQTWASLSQDMAVYHEAAHSLFTDLDLFERLIKRSSVPQIMKSIINAGEDGVIQRYILELYDIEDDLLLWDANFYSEIRQKDEIGPIQAISFGLMETGNVNAGVWEKILSGDIETDDRVLHWRDRIERVMNEGIKMRDGTERLRHFASFAEDVIDEFGPEDEDEDEHEIDEDLIDQLLVVLTGEKPQTEAPDVELDDDTEITVVGIDESSRDQSFGSQNQDDNPEEIWEENFEMFSETTIDEISVPDWEIDPSHHSKLSDIENAADNFADILRSVLQNERTSSRSFGQETGHLESSELAYCETGRRDIYSDRTKPEDKSYSIVFLLDRTGSMVGSRIRNAERTTYKLAKAVYDVGCEVGIISLYDTEAHMELPLGGDPERHRDEILSGRADGSTYLGECLRVVEEQLNEVSFDQSIVVTITDASHIHDRKQWERTLEDLHQTQNVTLNGIFVNEFEDERERAENRYSGSFDCFRSCVPSDTHQMARQMCYQFIR